MGHFLNLSTFLDLTWLLILILLFLYFGQEYRLQKKVSHWPKARGEVTFYELEKTNNTLWPKIEYTYRVDQQNYRGVQFFLKPGHKNIHSPHAKKLAYQITMAYQIGANIDVYYNPENPNESVLDVSVSSKITFLVVLLLALIMIQAIKILFI